MITIKNLSVFLIIILLTSCNDIVPVDNKIKIGDFTFPLSLISQDSTYGGITIATEHFFANNYDVLYNINGAIFDDQQRSNKVDGGTLTIDGINITVDNYNEYHYRLAQISDGDSIVISLSGNEFEGIDPFSTTMYLPTSIQMSLTDSSHEISKSNGIEITWNADNNNENGVFIGFWYKGSFSHSKDNSLPSQDSTFYKLIDDDGSYTVTSSDLNGFPINGYIQIGLVRANAITEGSVNRKYLIIGYSLSRCEFKVKF